LTLKKKLAIIISSALAGIAIAALIALNFGAVSAFFGSAFNRLFGSPQQADAQEPESGEGDEEENSGVPVTEDEENSIPAEESQQQESSAKDTESKNTSSLAAPTIRLEIYEGPSYSSGDDICYYRVRAIVTGEPGPEIEFSKDDSSGSLGYGNAQVNLTRDESSCYLTATATNTEGTDMDALTLTWNCNSKPVIAGISLSSDTIYVGKQYDVSVKASDLDGDPLTYDWNVSGGSLVDDKTNPVKWNTPDKPGDYTVSVAVNDGKGNISESSVKVYVGEVYTGETNGNEEEPVNLDLPKKESEGGYIEHGGVIGDGENLYAGDSSGNRPCAGFVSFDISDIAGSTIESATLSFTGASQSGSPLTVFDSLYINVLEWGAEPINENEFTKVGVAVASYKSSSITCNVSKLKEELQKAISSGKSRFQIRIHFSGPYTDNDDEKDGWSYSQGSVKLNVTFSK
ncbi:MAG: PKD domain-containing protein, partial [Actinobacteria bacterium]|nr:PKD domain-containing protein [Actinomycetota bacterium]